MSDERRDVTIRPPPAAAGAGAVPPEIRAGRDAVVEAVPATAEAQAHPPQVWIIPDERRRADALSALRDAQAALHVDYPDLEDEVTDLIAKLNTSYSAEEITEQREQFFHRLSSWFLKPARNPDLQEIVVIILATTLRAWSLSDG